MDTLTDVHQESTLAHIINDFEFHDFIDDPNFDQFIDLIRGENEDSFRNFDSDLVNACFFDDHFLSNPFDQCNNNNAANVYDPSSTDLSSVSLFDGVVEGGERGGEEEEEEEEEEENDGEHSSATTTTTTATTSANTKPIRPKADRSKTLISERRRRSGMKEKLHALRSLVPSITKMDKASIIGDAVSYVHDLQAQARKLTAEVEGLEASLLVSQNFQSSMDQNPTKVQFTHNNCHPICRKIIQMDMLQVDERGFYAKIVCNKAEGVAASLYRSLESLAGFNVQNSNLATVSDSYLLTFSINVKGSEPAINLPNLKLWVASALLNQGFEFIAASHA